ncbi:MAG: Asp-tRNA(Asn)/Glu-tRNA(Gln) amidotransferase subunit GatB [Candidatus Omnitrophica bacterium]|nr:Asp-tRNA(Asn)/Glu-tRNA(Gln) amidotransferase subunit GatB [Candidatus Omnitrophota bacterium]
MKYETVIGLEVHLHLNTRTKAFCGCSTEFGNKPNSQTCPVCLGFPGSLPVYNKTALDYAIKVALALNCQVQEYTKFDRKNYYYPDLPKNYQISQYDLPLSLAGFLDIEIEGKNKRIGITRVHMEEDAGKLIHKDSVSLVDLNRAGVPLLEIVSEPDISSPEEAREYLSTLKNTLEYLEVSDCDMEKGSLRCDANISIRLRGEKKLGVKIELKNMNSFKAVRDALAYEEERQARVLDDGEKLVQETRLWDEKEGATVVMRTKEGAQDYRYFPEPDLPPFMLTKSKIEEIRSALPESPKEKRMRFVKDYALTESDAKRLTVSKKDADFAEGLLKISKDKKVAANWLIGPLASVASDNICSISKLKINGGAAELNNLINLERSGVISNLVAKAVLSEMVKSGKTSAEIIKEKNLGQISDSGQLESIVEKVISANPKSVADFKSGKGNALMFLVGQAMKRSQGKANPKVLQDLFKRRLSNA